MKAIALVNSKGGVGKTTTAIGMSEILAKQGETVILADLDYQGSASAWAITANKRNKPLSFPVGQIPPSVRPAAIIRNVTETAQQAAATWVIIDTSPQDPDRADAAIELTTNIGGIIIVPSTTSSLDLPRALVTIQDINNRAPNAVLLTKTRTGTKRLTQARTELTKKNVNVLKTHIPLREMTAAAAEMNTQAFNELLTSHQPLVEEVTKQWT